MQEAIDAYFDSAMTRVEVLPILGGVNNCTKRLRVQQVPSAASSSSSDNEGEFIIRVYVNGNDTQRVQWEHDILAALRRHMKDHTTITFRTPEAILSRNGRFFEVLSTGTCCCVFKCIPGTLAKTTSPREVGRAMGQLSSILAAISPQFDPKSCKTPPYYDLWNVHHSIRTREAFDGILLKHTSEWFRAPLCDPELWQLLLTRLYSTADSTASLLSGGESRTLLRAHLIHGDLHYDNVLVSSTPPAAASTDVGVDAVTGLLDFEFVAFDWRAMELAIGLSKYLADSDPMPNCALMVNGYFEGLGSDALSEGEVRLIPQLIALRVLSNVVYFVGRAAAGEDGISSLTDRVSSYLKRLQWLETHADELTDVMLRSMKK